MKKYRCISCLILALVLVLALCACGKGEGTVTESPGTGTAAPATKTPAETSKPAEASPAAPAEGDRVYNPTHLIFSQSEMENRPKQIQPGTVFNYVPGNDVPSQLPWNCTSDGWLWQPVYDSLLYMYLGDVTDIRGCLAESWEHSEDYLTWTFKIRDGVKFHDGTVCDAHAIEKSWTIRQQVSPTSIKNNKITSWEAVDASTFIVKLSAPVAYFQQAMCGNALLAVSPTALDLYGTDSNQAAVGTGPYSIESYTSGVSIVLKANPDYFLDERMPQIETINFQFIADPNTVIMALLNGDVDGARFTATMQYYNLKDGGYEGTLVQTVGGASPLWFNPKKVPVFQHIEVRKAIDRFIDFDSINELIYDGMGIVGDSMWPVDTPGYVPYDGFYYDVDEGKELLASVGVSPSDISFETTTYSGEMNVAIQDQLAKVGIEMGVTIIEAEANFTYLKNGDWTLTIGSTGYSAAAPYTPWTLVLKPDAMIKQCWQDVYDPDLYQKMLDEFDKMVTAETWDQMIEHCKQITTYEQTDFGAVAGIQHPNYVAVSKDFKGAVFFGYDQVIQVNYLYK